MCVCVSYQQKDVRESDSSCEHEQSSLKRGGHLCPMIDGACDSVKPLDDISSNPLSASLSLALLYVLFLFALSLPLAPFPRPSAISLLSLSHNLAHPSHTLTHPHARGLSLIKFIFLSSISTYSLYPPAKKQTRAHTHKHAHTRIKHIQSYAKV